MCTYGNKFSSIDGFGEDLEDLVYEGLSNWFFSFRSILALFSGHFSYLVMQVSIIVVGILTLYHAKANGPRFCQFWWGAMIHGILSENGLTLRKYWHAQAFIMFFGKKLPPHMIFYYPSILYIAVMGMQKYKLNLCCESLAVGLLVMVMEIPFRIISVRFLHITYHDSDPAYASKLYGVPWIEIFSALIFAMTYTACYYIFKHQFISEKHVKWEQSEQERKEVVMTGLVGVLSPIFACINKVILFHLLYDTFNINAPTCMFLVCTICFSVLLCHEKNEEKQDQEHEGKVFLYYALGVYFACLLSIAMLCKPENEISIGTHEPIGDCTTLIHTRSLWGKAKKSNKYLCTEGLTQRQDFYNFNCVPNGAPSFGAIWYTICGAPIQDRNSFVITIAILLNIVLFAFASVEISRLYRTIRDKFKDVICLMALLLPHGTHNEYVQTDISHVFSNYAKIPAAGSDECDADTSLE